MASPKLPIVLAGIGSAAALDMVVESAGGGAISLLGRTLLAPGDAASTLILCAVSAAAALALVTSVAHDRGRRLERRMAEELDERWEEFSQRVAAESARAELLSWRSVELRTTVDELNAKRDGAYEEMRLARARVRELREAALQQRLALKELARVAESQLIVVPDLPTELLASGNGSEPIAEPGR